MSRQQELDADPKAIQEIIFTSQLNNEDGDENAEGAESMSSILNNGKLSRKES